MRLAHQLNAFTLKMPGGKNKLRLYRMVERAELIVEAIRFLNVLRVD